VIPLVGREGEQPIAMAWAGAWPAAATGDGDGAGNRPPRLPSAAPRPSSMGPGLLLGLCDTAYMGFAVAAR